MMRDVFEHVTIGICLLDSEMNFIGVNEIFSRTFGFGPSELEGHSFHRTLSFSGTDYFPQDFGDEECPLSFEVRLKSKGGEGIRCKMTFSCIEDSRESTAGVEGAVSYIVLVEDISERNRREEQFVKLFHAVEQSPSTVVITDLKGNIEYVNPKFTELTGYSFDEVVGKNPRILKTDANPPDLFRNLWSTIAAGGEWRGEFCNRRKDGSLFWEFASISPIKDEEGRILSYIKMAENITERKRVEQALQESEERFRKSLIYADIGSWDWNLETGAIFWTEGVWRLFGFGVPEGEMSYDSFILLVHPGDRETVAGAIEKCIQEGKKYSVEHRVIRHDGTIRWLREVGDVIRNDRGGAVRMLGIVQDITDQKEAELLREDIDRITRHDLKSPLNGIVGIPQALKNDPNLTDEQREYLQIIEEAGQNMLSMINASLTLYKIEQGNYRIQPERVNLVKVVSKILSENSGLLRSFKVTPSVVVDGKPVEKGGEFFVTGEEFLCYSMLSNIIINAIQASAEGAEVTVSMEKAYRPVISVHSHSVVLKDIRDVFFEKYVTAGKKGGTGLGTYSARLMAEAQGADISMNTSETDGTFVTITMPPGSPGASGAE